MTQLIRITHGVHRPAPVASDDLGRAAALLTACPPGTVLARAAAARLHGLWLPGVPELPAEVILRGPTGRPRMVAGCRRREISGRRRVLRTDEVEAVDGLPVTSAARTWLDLAERLSLPDLVAAGDSALRGTATLEQIDAVLARAVHRRGVVRARAARQLLDARSRSRPESHLRVALVVAGLPTPGVNEPVFDEDGQWLFEPDLSYDDARLAIEYDGADHASPDRMRRDITRELDGIVRGDWRMVTFGPTQVFRRPDQVALVVDRLRRDRLPWFRRG